MTNNKTKSNNRLMLAFNRTDLERLFSEAIWLKAEHLVGDGAVVDVNVERDGKSITGQIKGGRRTPYLTRIKIANGRGGRVRLSSTCSCFYPECEHAAATLLGLLDQSTTLDPEDGSVVVDAELESWVAAVNAATRNGHADAADVVLYLLEPAQRSWRDGSLAQPISINTARAKRLRSNAYGRENPVAIANLLADPAPGYVGLEDQVIGRLLGGGNGQSRRLGSRADGEALIRVLETGRCHWRNAASPPLHYVADPRRGGFVWRFDSEGQQHLVCEVDDRHDDLVVVALGEPWYIDISTSEVGRVETGVDAALAGHLVNAPAIPAAAATIIRQRLVPSGERLPLPEPLKKRERLETRPQPILLLHCPSLVVHRGTGWRREEQEVDCPLARVAFDYAGAEIGWQDGRPEINHVQNNRLLVLPRDTIAEVQAIERLNTLGLQPLGPTGLGRFAPEPLRQDFTFEEDEDDDVSVRWVEFNHIDVPKLRTEGWRVVYDETYPFQVIDQPVSWQIDLNDSGIDWFELDVGIDLDGERIPLLPVLLDLFQRSPEDMTPAALAAYGEEPVYGTLPDGRLLPIPAARLMAMLEALYEQFVNNRVDPQGRLRLAPAEASRLTVIDRTMTEDEVVWTGGERILRLARQLGDNDRITQIEPPKSLQAKLRPYQQQGLSWLQFLASVGLSGVLADDMGLGKTLQTLAHILCEKENGRLTRPALIVAPTSLIPTWRSEARRFAPSLNMLTLHGNNRSDLFRRIERSDIVLTSYALMLRDRDELVRRKYRMVVLDEAQAIKNPATKLAKVSCELEADHKIALSGTPMENHLGELWSVFHFLMPGFLGDRESFRRIFRQRIEKEGDTDRQALLVQRVRPFLMRRTKEEVASELPPKSEFIREIELSDEQRDLYESVRLAMHARVREEIEQRGLARSNIAILEALLKLRQICCDPRLLKKREGAAPASAKYEMLMSMIEGMVETGRRIIVFSQFVEMLELIVEGLEEQGIAYTILTGRTRDREAPVKKFQNGDVPVFLISLKAGGTGLTLTRADTVIHYDPWWNPAVEAQATDRAHRIGQDKTVFVYKLVASGTVEEKMVELQERKRSLVEGVLGGVKGGGMGLSETDIEALFAPLPD